MSIDTSQLYKIQLVIILKIHSTKFQLRPQRQKLHTTSQLYLVNIQDIVTNFTTGVSSYYHLTDGLPPLWGGECAIRQRVLCSLQANIENINETSDWHKLLYLWPSISHSAISKERLRIENVRNTATTTTTLPPTAVSQNRNHDE